MRTSEDHPSSPADRLITAATDLFYRRGFNAVSVEDIIQASQVTKPTLYRRFHSKDQLGAACLQRLTQAERDVWRDIAAVSGDDPRAQLSALIAHYADRLAQPGFRGSPFANAASELTEPDHPGRQVVELFEAETRSHLRALCEQAGSARPDVLADGLFLLLHGAAASRHFSAAGGPASALPEIAAALMEAHLPPTERP